jgi:hypothetical protein
LSFGIAGSVGGLDDEHGNRLAVVLECTQLTDASAGIAVADDGRIRDRLAALRTIPITSTARAR